MRWTWGIGIGFKSFFEVGLIVEPVWFWAVGVAKHVAGEVFGGDLDGAEADGAGAVGLIEVVVGMVAGGVVLKGMVGEAEAASEGVEFVE